MPPRPKPQDLPNMEGPGVAPQKFKDLDKLGDKYIEIRDQKADLATKLRQQESKIAELMVEKGIAKYQFSDQEIIIKPGKTHIVIRTVKVEGVEAGEPQE